MGAEQSGERRGVKTVQAVEKALRILETLGDAGRPRNLTELSDALDMNPSTLYRLLVTLCRSGFVTHDPKGGHYRLSLKAYRVGQAALEAVDFRRDAWPFMEELVERCNETVNLVVLQDREAVFVEQIESSNMLRSLVKVGSRIPAHATGGGKALLAELPGESLESLYRGNPLERFTPNTITSLDRLVAELKEVRRLGYAVDDEEREAGVRCVASPVRDHTGKPVAALTVSGPAGRLTTGYIRNVLSEWVVEYADRISERLGRKRQAAVV